jgi:histone H3/H4
MENLIVQSKVREMFKNLDCNTGSDALDQLNKEVERLIKEAARRTKENGRKTVKGADV